MPVFWRWRSQKKPFRSIHTLSLYIYSGPPTFFTVCGAPNLKLNHARTARDPRARRPPVTCQAAQLRTGAYERHLQRELGSSKTANARSASSARYIRARRPLLLSGSAPHIYLQWGRSGGGRQRLLEGDTAGVADVVAPDVQLLEHRRPRGLERRGERHRPLPRKGAP